MAYRASTHETTGVTPANMVFGRELRLPCDLMFGAPPDKEQSVTDNAALRPVALPGAAAPRYNLMDPVGKTD